MTDVASPDREHPPGRAHRLLVWAWLVATLLSHGAAFGQSPLMYNWGPNQGLVQYTITTIAQDPYGYIWLGAESGASRFNGREFTNFDNRNGFANEAVRNITVIGTDVYLLTETGSLFRAAGQGAEPIPVRWPVLAILAPPDASLEPWLVTPEGLLRGLVAQPERLPFDTTPLITTSAHTATHRGVAYLAVGEVVHTVGHTPPRAMAIGEEVQDLFVGSDDVLMAVTRSALVSVAETAPPTPYWSAPDGVVLSSGHAAHGRIVLGTRTGGIFVREEGHFVHLHHGLPQQAVMTVLIDRENNIWAGIDSGGLVLLPRAAFTSYTAADGVGTGDAFYIVADHLRGGVWVGTRNGGIAHVSDERVESYRAPEALPSDRVRSLFQSSSGHLFCGTETGIWCLEPDGSSWSQSAPAETYFQFFFEDSTGAVYSGSRSGTLVVWRGGKGLRTLPIELPRPIGLTAMAEYENTLLLGTTRGLFTLDGRPELAETQVRELVQNAQGNLWVSTLDRGAWKHELGRWTQFSEEDGFTAQVRFIVPGPDGRMWFGSNHGVWSYPDVENRLDTGHGLLSDNIFLLRFDPQGRLWIGHNLGLEMVVDDEVVARYDNRDGLADNELNANGFAVDLQGRLWFCTMRGVSRMNPTALVRSQVRPLIHLSGLEANQRWIPVADTRQERFRLDHSQNSVRFVFSGQSFVDPVGLRYTHRLEGLEDSWSRPDSVGWANYPKLPPGLYTFHVRCSSSDGLESPIASLEVEIVPALWQRLSFRILVALLGVGVLFGSLIVRNRRIVARNLELKRLVNQRTADLAAANEELKRLSITDPLTGLFNRRFFEEEIQSELASALRAYRNARSGSKRRADNLFLCMFMLDLDHFKRINDEHGHDAGDAVLREFSQEVRQQIRESDTLFRWGGEEFLLLARNTDPHSGEVLAERIRRAVCERVCHFEGLSLQVSCSIGYVPFPFNAGSPGTVGWSELLHIADQALYLAKDLGRNAYVGVRGTENLASNGRLTELLNDLVAARDAGLVELESNLALPPLKAGHE